MNASPRLNLRSLFLALWCLGCTLSALRAQGGPPMITDDPGTPGDKHWEINVALTTVHVPGEKESELPLLDINYGIGDRIQLKYEAAWLVLKEDGRSSLSGLSNSLAGVKWRFYGAGEEGWQISTYPQVEFENPGSSSADRGLAEPGTGFLLPFEFQKGFGKWSLNFEASYFFHSSGHDEIGYGLVVGGDVAHGVELLAEIHGDCTSHFHENALALNFGARFEVSERYSVLASIGREISHAGGPKATFFGYLGWQTRL